MQIKYFDPKVTGSFGGVLILASRGFLLGFLVIRVETSFSVADAYFGWMVFLTVTFFRIGAFCGFFLA